MPLLWCIQLSSTSCGPFWPPKTFLRAPDAATEEWSKTLLISIRCFPLKQGIGSRILHFWRESRARKENLGGKKKWRAMKNKSRSCRVYNTHCCRWKSLYGELPGALSQRLLVAYYNTFILYLPWWQNPDCIATSLHSSQKLHFLVYLATKCGCAYWPTEWRRKYWDFLWEIFNRDSSLFLLICS